MASYSDKEHFAAIGLIFCAGVLGAAGAKRMRSNARALSRSSALGGGVFVGAGFIHLLGDSAEAMENYDSDYPFAMMWASVGVLLTLLVEEGAMALLQRSQAGAGGGREKVPSSRLERPGSINEVRQNSLLGDGSDGLGEMRASLVEAAAGGAAAAGAAGEPAKEAAAGARAMATILYVALSFHSCMAGLGVGVNKGVWGITAAIVAHKGVAAFALGTSILRVEDRGRPSYAAAMLPFCLVTPIAALVGMSLRGEDDADPVTNAVVAMAGGTFIYIGLMEIIAKELPGSDKPTKICLIVLGWGLMALLAKWT